MLHSVHAVLGALMVYQVTFAPYYFPHSDPALDFYRALDSYLALDSYCALHFHCKDGLNQQLVH